MAPGATSSKSVITYDDISSTELSTAAKTPLKKASLSPGKPSKINTRDKPYESVPDIFSGRLRTLRKRLQKIEKNEEILASERARVAKLKASPSASPSCPASSLTSSSLDADQLKAIERKDTLLAIISEFENMNLVVSEWMSIQQPSATKTDSGKVSNPKQAETIIERASCAPSSSFAPFEKYKEIMELWIGLGRLDSTPTGLIPSEDYQGLRALHAILQSIVSADDYEPAIKAVLSWMSSEEENYLNICDVCPPYAVVRYCIKKMLSTPMSVAHQTVTSPLETKRGRKPSKKEQKDHKKEETPSEKGPASLNLDSGVSSKSSEPLAVPNEMKASILFNENGSVSVVERQTASSSASFSGWALPQDSAIVNDPTIETIDAPTQSMSPSYDGKSRQNANRSHPKTRFKSLSSSKKDDQANATGEKADVNLVRSPRRPRFDSMQKKENKHDHQNGDARPVGDGRHPRGNGGVPRNEKASPSQVNKRAQQPNFT